MTFSPWKIILVSLAVHLTALVAEDVNIVADRPASKYPVPSEEFSHKAELDEQGNYFLFWKFDEETITFEVHAKTKGWVGFGLSDNGAMRGADIVVGWIKDGKTSFTDRYATGHQRPLVDNQQDYNLLASQDNGNFTIFKFSRKLQTCDLQDYHIQKGTVRVIFAWNNDKPTDENSFSYHGAENRGSKSLLLIDNSARQVDISASETLKSFTIGVSNVSLPKNRTYYHCRIVALPDFDGKNHVVKISPMINTGNEGVVHHILAYLCHGNLTEEVYGRNCWTEQMPDEAGNCQSLAYAWAIGVQEYIFPNEAGLSVGGPGDPKFLHIEMHYDNPQYLSGVVDSSGFEFFYTSQLREHDVGVMIVGHTVTFPPLIIPPKTDEFRIVGYCGSACTSQIPDGGVSIFATVPHTHLAGRRVYTRHIRAGTELPELTRDNHYDFNFQIYRTFKTHRKFLPGDELITTCVYSTQDRNGPILGGPATLDEMCLDFVFYYPKMDISSCLSHGLISKQETFGYLSKREWNAEDVTALQSKLDERTDYDQFCARREGQPLLGGGESTRGKVTNIDRPLALPDECAPKPTPSEQPSGARDGRAGVAMTTVMVVFMWCL